MWVHDLTALTMPSLKNTTDVAWPEIASPNRSMIDYRVIEMSA
jgi:hypothetical protein